MSRLVDTRPAAAEPRPFRFPEVVEAAAEGVVLRAVHLPGRPRARLTVLADAGAAAELAGTEGAAGLVGDVLLRGANGLDAHGLAVAFERFGAQPSTSVGYDTGVASLEAPAGVLPDAANLLAEVVRRPTLDERAITETRDALVDEKRSSMTRAEAIVARGTRRAVWAPTSRYATSAIGTEDTIAGLSVDDVRTFHERRWAAGKLFVIVVGDLTGVDLDEAAKAFAGAASATPSKVDVAAADGGAVLLADRPGAAQSALLLSHPAFALGEPDEPDLDVALAASVGSFSGRLNQRLREELGYTYGARGGVARRRHGGSFSASMSVRTEVTADAVRETVEVLRRAVDDGLDADEVDQARDNVVRKYPVKFDSNGAIASAVAEVLVHDLPADHHDRYLERLQGVDVAAANAALRRLLDVDGLVIGVAGDAAEVADGLAELGRGDVERVTP